MHKQKLFTRSGTGRKLAILAGSKRQALDKLKDDLRRRALRQENNRHEDVG